MTDKDTTRAKRAARFLEMDKAQKPSAASKKLHRAKHHETEDHRAAQFARIERGKET